MRIFCVFAVLISSVGCVIAETPTNSEGENLIDALIIGSAESPDPILNKVRELERDGLVKDVVVLESFPLQIHLQATKEIIEELDKIPRIKGNLQ